MGEITTPGVARTGRPRDGVADAETPHQLQLVLRRFVRHRLAVASLIVLVLVIAFAFFGPLLWPYDHLIHRQIPSSQPPSLDHPFGTTTAGHDVMGQVMRGTQQSLKVAFTVALVSTTIGALWGAVAGLFGGWLEALMMRIVDVVLVIPMLLFVSALAASSHGGTGWWGIALVMSLFFWTTASRLVHGVVRSLREQMLVEAASAIGASNRRIVLRHLLPNASGPIIVFATLTVADAILVEAALSFLGFGIQPPDASLGLLIESARTAPFVRPWLFYPPGILIIVIALTVNLVGDGLRGALDPRQALLSRRRLWLRS